MRPTLTPGRADPRRSLASSLLLGIGLMAGLDEIVFHQLLAWHHFFDWSTLAFGLVSDGLLHSGELIILVLGFFMLADLRARHALAPRMAWASFVLGLGGFQLFDGIVDHKVLRLDQVRYVDHLLPYDLAWDGVGVLLLLIGYALYRHARAREGAAPDAAGA